MRRRWLFLLFCLALLALFSSLGVWQIERRAWKLDLIAQVNARIKAAPIPAPGPSQWPTLTRENAEYSKVRVTGEFLNDRETLVQAMTEFGGGYWVLTPLKTSWGTVLINRGFVSPERADPSTRAESELLGIVAVTGLLRMSEPRGDFLRSNRPAEGRWYSRDIVAIARSRKLRNTAPYFIDADAAPVPGGWPKGGLTVVRFRNAHLQYAITWFGLALLSAWGAFIVWKRG